MKEGYLVFGGSIGPHVYHHPALRHLLPLPAETLRIDYSVVNAYTGN